MEHLFDYGDYFWELIVKAGLSYLNIFDAYLLRKDSLSRNFQKLDLMKIPEGNSVPILCSLNQVHYQNYTCY